MVAFNIIITYQSHWKTTFYGNLQFCNIGVCYSFVVCCQLNEQLIFALRQKMHRIMQNALQNTNKAKTKRTLRLNSKEWSFSAHDQNNKLSRCWNTKPLWSLFATWYAKRQLISKGRTTCKRAILLKTTESSLSLTLTTWLWRLNIYGYQDSVHNWEQTAELNWRKFISVCLQDWICTILSHSRSHYYLNSINDKKGSYPKHTLLFRIAKYLRTVFACLLFRFVS